MLLKYPPPPPTYYLMCTLPPAVAVDQNKVIKVFL